MWITDPRVEDDPPERRDPPPLVLADWRWAELSDVGKALMWEQADYAHGGKILLTGALGKEPSLLRRDR